MEPTILKTTEEDMRLYEIALLLSGSLSDKERQETLKNVEALLKEKNVTVLQKDEWRPIGLAYKIKGHLLGRYVLYYVQARPKVVRDIESSLGIEHDVLRHLVIKLPEGYKVMDWTDHFTTWKESLEQEKVEEAKQHEDKLKKQIVQRASLKKPEQAKQEEKKRKSTEEVSEKELDQKLSEIISNEDLHL